VKRVLLYLLSCLIAGSVGAQGKKGDNKDLFEAILRMDRHLSDAFNAHNADRLMGLATNNFEFYDENGGLRDFQQCFADFRAVFDGGSNVRRELIENTVDVYPINGYGALELGQNRLCHTENDKDECHVSNFAMVWQKDGDSWKLSRMISYGQ
jgi:ketosteroid isomerase-like protein